jgi:23S rRNA pseudouridine2605 synthase
MALIRINKFLADSGVSSRRGADALIEIGVVRVNGKILMEPGMSVDPTRDVVTVKGERVGTKEKLFRYVAIYKPAGYVSTVKDTHADKTVLDLFTSKERVYPVGRLDKDSEGLMFLTNDGDFALKLTHPRYHVAKTYRVLVKGSVTPDIISRLTHGVKLDDGYSKASQVRVVSTGDEGIWLDVVLHEGKKRQIRRMCAACRLHVKRLVRVAIGEIELENLREGKWRELTDADLKSLEGSVRTL